jgi:ribosomal protein L29
MSEIDDNEKDLFSLAAQKGAGGHESRCRRVKRSLSELNRR